MFSGISTVCFAASYALALALELVRLLSGNKTRNVWLLRATLLSAAAGLVAHTLFLYHRAVTADSIPLSSSFDWDLLAAWALAVVYIFLSLQQPRTPVGLFLLPLVLGLVGLAQFANGQPFPQSRAGQVWGTIHGLFLLLGLVAVAVGFVAGLMYLIQSYRLKRKQSVSQRLRLPSLEWLERVNSRAIVVSTLMVGAGFLSGIVLNVVLAGSRLDELPWNDPVVWRSALMFGWLLAAAVFSALYRPARSGRKVAYLTVASFAFLALSLGIRLLVPSQHRVAAERQNAERRTQNVDSAFCFSALHSPFPIPHSPLPAESILEAP